MLTSRSCSCVLAAPPSNWLTRAPTALDGPAPSVPAEHMSLPVTSVRSAMLTRLLDGLHSTRSSCTRTNPRVSSRDDCLKYTVGLLVQGRALQARSQYLMHALLSVS